MNNTDRSEVNTRKVSYNVCTHITGLKWKINFDEKLRTGVVYYEKLLRLLPRIV